MISSVSISALANELSFAIIDFWRSLDLRYLTAKLKCSVDAAVTIDESAITKAFLDQPPYL